MSDETQELPTLAVWKFTSCDGCQLSLLDLEDELLLLTERVTIAHFPEATRQSLPGAYTVSLVEGSISTPEHLEQIQDIRRQSHVLIAIGACATAGGIQALRNFADVEDFIKIVYPSPQHIQSLSESTPISDHVRVDFELRGCPINKYQLLEVLNAFLNHRRPNITDESVCIECKRKGNVCVLVTGQSACLGLVTHAGCNALCPSYNRGCFGCYGPKENANPIPLSQHLTTLGVSTPTQIELFRNFNSWAPAFREASKEIENGSK